MQIIKPAYHDRFRCLASDCPDSCCKEWDVQIDPETANFYQKLEGTLGQRLRQVMTEDPDAGTIFINENGRCPMWRSDSLCRIQAELGHEALCKTCRDFPRLTHDYGDFMELGLELSCPEAARLILTDSDAAFVIEDRPGGEAPEYDEDTMDLLQQSRAVALSFFSDGTYSAPKALALLLFYGYHIQTILEGGVPPPFDPENILCRTQTLAKPQNAATLLQFFSTLEILSPTWLSRLNNPENPDGWPNAIKNLAKYGIQRYWLQTVSDEDLICRVKMIIAFCLTVKILGGDTILTAQAMSKEIENNADNIDVILDAAYLDHAFSDLYLLGLLFF